MMLDDTTSDIIVDISKRREIPLKDASNAVEGFYKTLRHIIEKKEHGVIKADFLGKFYYSHAYKKTKEDIIEKSKNNEVI